MTDIQLLNRVGKDRVSHVTVGIPFDQGELQATDSLKVTNATSAIEKVHWYPQGARWSDGSIRYARATFPVEINAGQDKQVTVGKGSSGVTARPFTVDAGVINSINNTQIQVRLQPKIFAQVTSPLINVTKITRSDGTNWVELEFADDILDGNLIEIYKEGSPSYYFDKNANYRIRIEGLQGEFAPLNGRVLNAKLDPSQLPGVRPTDPNPVTKNKLWLKDNSSQTAYYSGDHTFNPANHPNNIVHTQFWNVDHLLSKHTLTLNLDGTDGAEVLEGNPSSSSTDFYVRTRYFKRFSPHPSGEWDSFPRMYLELVIDTFSNRPYQRFWLRLGHSDFRAGYGRTAGPLPYSGIFYAGTVDLVFKSKDGVSPVAQVNLREEDFQTKNRIEETTKVTYQILKDLGEGVQSWEGKTALKGLRFEKTDTFMDATCLAYKGTLYHGTNAIGTPYEAELKEDTLGIAMNWEGRLPPYNVLPDYPPWIPDRATGIQKVDELVAALEAKKTPNEPRQNGILAAAPSPGQGGDQAFNFGATRGYWMFKTAWPAIIPLMQFDNRNEYLRASFYMPPDGSKWERTNYTDQFICWNGELFSRNSQEFGGIGPTPEYGSQTHPEGYLLGPNPGGDPYTKRQRPQSLLSNGLSPTPNDGKSYKTSHFMFPWACHDALVTMDYWAIEYLRVQKEMIEVEFNPNSLNKTIYGTAKAGREIGRPYHMASLMYEVLGDDDFLAFMVRKLGHPEPNIGYWGDSGTKTILEDPVNYPNPYDFTATFQPWWGFDARALITGDTHDVGWMEGIFSRGVFAFYLSLIRRYGSEANFPSDLERNIAKMIKVQSACTTLHEFIINATDDVGAMEYVKGLMAHRWEDDTTVDVRNLSPTSEVWFDVEIGDTLTSESDPSFTADVLHVERIDKCGYDPPGSFFRDPGTAWHLTYLILLHNKSKSLPWGDTTFINTRNNSKGRFNRELAGYISNYGCHAGFMPKTNVHDTYGWVDRTGPGLPTGSPLQEADYSEPGGYIFDLNPPDNTILHTPDKLALSEDPPRYWTITTALTIWSWPSAVVALYFANRNEYGADNDRIRGKASAIIADAIDRIPQPSNGGWDVKFTPFLGFVENYSDSDSFFHIMSRAASRLQFEVPSPTLIAAGSDNVNHNASVVLDRFKLPNPEIDASSGGGTSYNQVIDNAAISFFDLPEPNIHTQVDVSLTTNVISNKFSIPGGRVFTESGEPSIIDWDRTLDLVIDETTLGEGFDPPELNGLLRGGEGDGIGAIVDEQFNLFGLPWTPDEYIVASTYITNEDLSGLYGIDTSIEGYNGPLPGYFIDGDITDRDREDLSSANLQEISIRSFSEYLESAEYYNLIIKSLPPQGEA